MRTREVVQLQKCLFGKQEDLSSILKIHMNKAEHGGTYFQPWCWGDRDKDWDPNRQAGLLGELQASERPGSKEQSGSHSRGMTPEVVHWPHTCAHPHTSMYLPLHTHINMHTNTTTSLYKHTSCICKHTPKLTKPVFQDLTEKILKVQLPKPNTCIEQTNRNMYRPLLCLALRNQSQEITLDFLKKNSTFIYLFILKRRMWEGAGEIDYQLRALAAFSEDLVWFWPPMWW